jgi:putative ABC transport system permease protein
VVTAITIFLVLRVRPWYDPRYFLPMLGMILGNSLNGIAIAIDRFNEELIVKRDAVDARLALGATRWEAARPSVVTAVRIGLIPIINSMMVVGIVNIPGMMTGQLLGGVAPMQAVRYQIVMMFFITATTTLGTIGVVILGYRKLFDHRHRFLAQLVTSPATRKPRRRKTDRGGG